MSKKVEKTGNYEVIDDAGKTHIITIFTTFTEHKPVSGARQWLPGRTSHTMSNGDPVNVNDDGSVEDVLGSRIMRRVHQSTKSGS